MTPTQIQLPDPPYQQFKVIAEQQDWLLSEVEPKVVWRFPTLDCGGDFLIDPASLRPEADT